MNPVNTGILLHAITLALFAPIAGAQNDRFDAIANAITENRPSPETAQALKDELPFQRAAQTICGLCR